MAQDNRSDEERARDEDIALTSAGAGILPIAAIIIGLAWALSSSPQPDQTPKAQIEVGTDSEQKSESQTTCVKKPDTPGFCDFNPR